MFFALPLWTNSTFLGGGFGRIRIRCRASVEGQFDAGGQTGSGSSQGFRAPPAVHPYRPFSAEGIDPVRLRTKNRRKRLMPIG
jgi:hypothetical protein